MVCALRPALGQKYFSLVSPVASRMQKIREIPWLGAEIDLRRPELG
jgi:hypothetical protein